MTLYLFMLLLTYSAINWSKRNGVIADSVVDVASIKFDIQDFLICAHYLRNAIFHKKLSQTVLNNLSREAMICDDFQLNITL